MAICDFWYGFGCFKTWKIIGLAFEWRRKGLIMKSISNEVIYTDLKRDDRYFPGMPLWIDSSGLEVSRLGFISRSL